jgi:hypothetical protein
MAELEKYLQQLTDEGFAIIPEVLPAAEIERTKVAIDEVYEAEREIATKYGLQNKNLLMCFNAQGKHPHLCGLALRYPKPVEVVRGLLGDDMFAHNVAIRKPLPTGVKDWTRLGGNLHADWADFTVKPFVGGRHFPMAVQSVWAISDFTVESGATYLWPGGISIRSRGCPRRTARNRGVSPDPGTNACPIFAWSSPPAAGRSCKRNILFLDDMRLRLC